MHGCDNNDAAPRCACNQHIAYDIHYDTRTSEALQSIRRGTCCAWQDHQRW